MINEKKQITQYQSRHILQSVQDSYNSFAKQWDTSRQHHWYEFTLAAKNIQKHDALLDIGCGNGRFYSYIEQESLEVEYQGIDNASALIAIAKAKHPKASFLLGDALALPYRNESFTIVVSFAVLHHITPRSNRSKFFAEIARVLKPGGSAFITVWNVHQPKYSVYLRKKFGQKLLEYLTSPFNPAFGKNDCFIPFGEEKTLRYIHGFTPNELAKLASKYFTIQEQYYTLKDGLTPNWKSCRNICLLLKKT